MMKKILGSLKAIAALVGAAATYTLTLLPPDQYKWLGIVAGVATFVGTWAVPNITSPKPPTQPPASKEAWVPPAETGPAQ